MELHSFFIDKPTQTSDLKTQLDYSLRGINRKVLRENGYGHHRYFFGQFQGGFGWSGEKDIDALQLMEKVMIMSYIIGITQAVYQIGKEDYILELNATFQQSRPFKPYGTCLDFLPPSNGDTEHVELFIQMKADKE